MPEIRDINTLAAFEMPVKKNFTFTVWVDVKGAVFADAAGVLLRSTKEHWIKVCFERSQSLEWKVVTVVSKPCSDESHGPTVLRGCGGLLVTRSGSHFGILWSEHKEMIEWKFIRAFWWPCPDHIQFGLFAQAPFSDSCIGKFSNLSLYSKATNFQR